VGERQKVRVGNIMNRAIGKYFGDNTVFRVVGSAGRYRRVAGTGWLAAAIAVWLLGAGAFHAQAQPGTQELRLTVGKSVVIDYPSDIGRISTSNPEIVDAVPITSREILLNAKAFGQSTIVVWSKTGERSFFAVTVEPSLDAVRKLLKDAFPNENIEVVAQGA